MTTGEEDRILQLVLKYERPDDGYAIVNRLTSYDLDDLDNDTIVAENREKKIISEKVIAELLRQMMEKNRKAVIIGLKSDQRNGYFIDSKDEYAKATTYDWEKIRKERPKVSCRTLLSRPAYDSENEIVMVYVQKDRGRGDCFGEVKVYKYSNGILEELLRALVYIS